MNLTHIKPNTFVILDLPKAYEDYIEYYENLLGVKNAQGGESMVMCLGEISNMKGHYLIVNPLTSKIVPGLHPDCFRLPTDDEL